MSINIDMSDMNEVRGHQAAKAIIESAASMPGQPGNLMLVAPPGAGALMLARRAGGILPPMTWLERLEATAARVRAGLQHERDGLVEQRPFRAPHHTISKLGMVGAAQSPGGEVELARHGVLCLDQVPEFSASVLERLAEHLCLRQVWVIALAYPCPCGWAGHPDHGCSCSDAARTRYDQRVQRAARLFGMRRVDMAIQDVQAVGDGETTGEIQARVIAAQKRGGV